MTVCQACKQRDAVVHLTQVEGDEVTTLRLCSKCAAERGIETDATTVESPLGVFLSGLDPAAHVAGSASLEAAGDPCPECGATLQDFRASGRVGCPACWNNLARPLTDLLRRLHGATVHTGERYALPAAPATPEAERQQRRTELREQLRVAVASEQFERAAQVRDQLRHLEQE
jgi:protein arginine kinase activator